MFYPHVQTPLLLFINKQANRLLLENETSPLVKREGRFIKMVEHVYETQGSFYR